MSKALFIISIVIILLDQLTKWLVTQNIGYGEIVPVFFWLDLNHIGNKGVAFSMFANLDSANVVFMLVASFAIVAISFWLWKLGHKEGMLVHYAMLFVLGGACGNLIDRIKYGYVIDFIAVHYKDWYYPSFNIADSAITIGAALLVINIVFMSKKQ